MQTTVTETAIVSRIWFLLVACVVAMFAPPALGFAARQDTGYIQVQCEPGLQIFLDGVLKGVSNRDQDGLVIEDVPVGTRVVKAVKPGFTPQEQPVTVGNGEIKVLQIELHPRLGSVLIKSLPVECTVTLERSSGGGWDSIEQVDKTKPEARVSKLQIGTYRVTASRSNGTLSKSFELAENDEVTVFFNFVGKTAEVSSEAAAVAPGIKYASENSTVVDLGSGVSMRFIEIKPGRFMMGSPESERGRDDDETQHEVMISKAYWLGQTEVTQAQWQAVMGSDPSRFTGNPSHPVEGVSWNDAQEFCRRLSQKTGMTFRLPTEAEWEYACRAGTTTAYSAGDDPSRLSEYAWFTGNTGGMAGTKPVATRKPNAWGLHDMHGNVWEWCSDWYGNYSSRSVTDPQGPRSGTGRVLRGGSWVDYSGYCRASARVASNPGVDGVNYGFRAARTP